MKKKSEERKEDATVSWYLSERAYFHALLVFFVFNESEILFASRGEIYLTVMQCLTVYVNKKTQILPILAKVCKYFFCKSLKNFAKFSKFTKFPREKKYKEKFCVTELHTTRKIIIWRTLYNRKAVRTPGKHDTQHISNTIIWDLNSLSLYAIEKKNLHYKST